MTTPELPYDLEAERDVLGAILLDRDAIAAVADLLVADMFYLERHQQVYAAALACWRRREPPDVRMVAAELRRQGAPIGVVELADLVEHVATAYHVGYHAGLVRDAARKRQLIRAGGQIAALGYDTRRTAEEATADAVQVLTGATLAAAPAGFVSISEAITAQEDAPAGDEPGFVFGHPDLDRLIGSVLPGELVLIAGLSGSGKSTLAVQGAWECAKHIGPAGVVTLEMTRADLIGRLIAYETGISTHAQRGAVHLDTLTRMMRAKGEIASRPLYIDDTPALTPQAVRASALRLAQRVGDLRVLVVDYLGLLQLDERMHLSAAMDKASNTMKQIARELNCPVVLCTQLNRELLRRELKIPTLGDINQGGEKAADFVIVPVRPQSFDPTSTSGDARLFVVKNRHGPPGAADAFFDGERYRFRPLAKYRDVSGYEGGYGDDHAA